MYDNQRIVDEIREVIYGADTADIASAAELVALYSEACTVVNDRLRACYALLEQGLRTEAIAECELPPNVLAQFAILDFPELSDWNTLLQRWNMILPPELFSDLAMALNEAYSQEQPLLTLLAKHRLLALGQLRLDCTYCVSSRNSTRRTWLGRMTWPKWRRPASNSYGRRWKQRSRIGIRT